MKAAVTKQKQEKAGIIIVTSLLIMDELRSILQSFLTKDHDKCQTENADIGKKDKQTFFREGRISDILEDVVQLLCVQILGNLRNFIIHCG